MADLIIAHAPADAGRAKALADALSARGFDVALSGAPTAVKAVLALWSEQALASEEVCRSAAEALARGALIGARLGPIEEANAVGPIQADLSAWPGTEGEAAFERLVQAAARLRGRPAMAAATRARGDVLMRRALYGAGAVALVAVAAIALTPAMRPKAAPPVPSAEQAEPTGGAVEFTDSPGARETYGLTEEEIRTREPRALIELALERTAIETIEAEAARGDGLGLTLLCLAQTYGEGLQEDANGAERSCARASNARDGLATYMLSTLTRKGKGGHGASAAETAEADRLLERAATEGDPRAQTELARARLKTDRAADAFALAQRAAVQGYAPAQVLIGEMYERGLRELEQDN